MASEEAIEQIRKHVMNSELRTQIVDTHLRGLRTKVDQSTTSKNYPNLLSLINDLKYDHNTDYMSHFKDELSLVDQELFQKMDMIFLN